MVGFVDSRRGPTDLWSRTAVTADDAPRPPGSVARAAEDTGPLNTNWWTPGALVAHAAAFMAIV